MSLLLGINGKKKKEREIKRKITQQRKFSQIWGSGGSGFKGDDSIQHKLEFKTQKKKSNLTNRKNN